MKQKAVFKNARWIWHTEPECKNDYCEFTAGFTIDQPVESCFVNICGDSNYALYLNGNLVDFGQYHDFPEHNVYDTPDLLPYLRKGANHVYILAYSHGEIAHWYLPAKAALIFEIIADGRDICRSDESVLSRRPLSYKCGEMYKFTHQLGYSYHYFDGAEEKPYIRSKIIDREYRFYPRPVPKLVTGEAVGSRAVMQGVFLYRKDGAGADRDSGGPARRMQNAFIAHTAPVKLTGLEYIPAMPHANGVDYCAADPDIEGVYVIIDLYKETAGLFCIDILTEEDADIDVAFGEHLNDGRVRSFIDVQYAAGFEFAFELTAKGGKRLDYTCLFKRFGARYLQLFIHSRRFKLFNCSLKPTVYPLKKTGKPFGNALWQRIYDTCERTLELCVHERYEDCPWREQALYTFDSRNQMLCGYSAFGEFKMPRACIEMFSRSLRPDGHLEICPPCRMWPTIPVFSLVFILQLYEYVENSNDKTVLAFAFKTAGRIIETFLRQADETGVMKAFSAPQYWNFYEWSEGMSGAYGRDHDLGLRHDAPLSAFMIIALDRFAKLCERVGKDSAKYRLAADKMREDAHNYFWAEGKGYATYSVKDDLSVFSEFTNTMMLYAGAVPERLKERLLDELFEQNGLVKMTISPTVYKYDAALAYNKEKYLPKVLNEIEVIWGNMLFQGATSFWETQKGAEDFNSGGSLCHGWSAVPLYIFNKYLPAAQK